MPKLAFLGLLTALCLQIAPQLALAQAAPAKRAPATKAPAPLPTPAAAEAPAPVAPPAPPGAFPQAMQPVAAPDEAPPPPPPPGAGTYPYGYGYGYVAPPVDPQRQQTLGELQTVDLRIVSVRKQQRKYGIVGPIAMTGAGYLLAAGFGLGAIVEWLIAEDIQHGDCRERYSRTTREYESYCDVDNNGRITNHDEHSARVMARTFGVISAVGAGVGIAGTVFLMKRLAKRRQYSPELNELGARRGQLLQQLRYGGGYSHNGMQLTISGRF